MIRNGKAIDHSNVGGLGGSLIAFLVSLASLVGTLYATSFWSLDTVWVPGLIALALSVVAFIIPKQILGRADTVDTVAVYAQNPTELHAGHPAAGTLPGTGSHTLGRR
ncbi:hypothetical protein [Micrococcus sp.]|uniref:hypothetical protein n=1 Tax=Micrococcus sp. TaxID=1271 RepID=UPI002A9108B5|nr:hypothetical protein [Micrococcus sp.]MDY6054827.1 hypothetical protein [Micrococcus sp.]